jgi:iron complex outermembrane receptor protein
MDRIALARRPTKRLKEGTEMQATTTSKHAGIALLRRGLLGQAALGAMLMTFSGQAFAQTDAAAAAPAADEGQGDDTNIVVTAQRREQRLQDVPIAVSAFSQRTLEVAGITSSTELTQITPSLNSTQTAFFAQPTIRGVGTFNTHIGDEPNVATYVDGVYVSQMIGSFYNFSNIERIEVLRGPQGTLFGRNATGGALNITTRAPSQEFEFEGQLTYGRFNQIEGSAYLSGGISEGVAANIAGYYGHRDGLYTNIALNNREEGQRDNFMIRARVVMDPWENVKLTLTGDISRTDDPQGILTHVLNRNSPAESLGINTTVRDYDLQTQYSPQNIIQQQGISLIAEIRNDLFTFISTTAYRHTTQAARYDSDSSPGNFVWFGQDSAIDDVMQEIRFVSPSSRRLEWVVGGFFFRSNSGYTPLDVRASPITPSFFVLRTDQQATALAAFADLTFHITDQFSLTGGIRYSDETKEFSFNRTPNLPPSLPQSGDRPDVSFSSWTPRAVLSWNVNDNILLYGSYSRGFKSGGYNTSSPQDAPYRPETLDAFEIGAKTTLAPGITFNVAAFHYNYKDLQVQSLAVGAGTATVTNAATAKMDGVEVEFNARITPEFSVRASAAYLHARYDTFENAGIYIPNVNTVPGTGNRICVDRRPVNGPNECDVSGLQLPRAPDFTFNIGANYQHRFDSGHSIRLSGNAYYSSSYPWDSGGRIFQDSYVLLNAQAELSFPGDHFSVTVWGKNLTDERVFNYVSISGAGDRSSFADPTTYGITGRFRF